MKAISFLCRDVEQLNQKLSDAIEEGFSPKLSLVFSSVQHNLEIIKSIFSKRQIDLIGCSTAGEIVDKQLYEGTISVLLLDINPAFYQIELEEYQNDDAHQIAQEIGVRAKKVFAKPGLIVMSGGLVIDADALVAGFRSVFNREVPIYGGLAGDDLQMKRTYAFTNQKVSDKGLAILIFDTEKIDIQGLAISGWQAVGTENVVTKAVGNVVYAINNEPAYNVFTRYFGFSKLDATADKLITLQTNYPFQFIREEGHSILRSPILLDEKEGTITLAASVREGDRFRFSYSPGFEIIEQTVEGFSDFQKRASQADALILFSCKGRHGAFGPMLEKEISGIFDLWKKPMTGFLTYGEIGDIGNGICEFHNETCSLVLLNEK